MKGLFTEQGTGKPQEIVQETPMDLKDVVKGAGTGTQNQGIVLRGHLEETRDLWLREIANPR